MPRHVSTLGFPVTTEQDFRHYVYESTEFGEKIETPNGSYTCWMPGNGIELWAQTNRHRRLLGMNPHFHGNARARVRITGRIPRYECSILDGAFYAWACPDTPVADGGLFPYVFDVPDYDTYHDLPIPDVVTVQLAAFANVLQGFATEDYYRAARGKGSKRSAIAFQPNGLFTPDGRTRRPAQAQVTFSGRVLAVKMIVNPVTWQKFYGARVQTLIGEVDVVADPQVVQGPIVVGGIVHGDFWLSGRILHAR